MIGSFSSTSSDFNKLCHLSLDECKYMSIQFGLSMLNYLSRHTYVAQHNTLNHDVCRYLATQLGPGIYSHFDGLQRSKKTRWLWAQCLARHCLGSCKIDVSSVQSELGKNGTFFCFMVTSSNGNIFHVTGPSCGEFTGPGDFPTQRPVTRSLDVFFDLRLINDWVNNREAGDLRRHRGHYDVIVMGTFFCFKWYTVLAQNNLVWYFSSPYARWILCTRDQLLARVFWLTAHEHIHVIFV